MSGIAELEARYPDVPPRILLKANILFSGIAITKALIDAGKKANPHFRPLVIDRKAYDIPYFLRLPDDQGGIMLVLVRPNSTSPYRIEKDADGSFVIFEKENLICCISPQPKPAWHTWADEHGLSRMPLALNQHGDMLVANLTPACEYWLKSAEDTAYRCRFCGYGAVSERSKSLGQRWAIASVDRDVLAEFKQAVAKARSEVRHLYLVGGSMRNRDSEGARYLEITKAAIRADRTYRDAIGCGSQALPGAWSKKIHAAGAGYACYNLEVWDPKLWTALCPGKAKFIGRDQWLQDMTDAVEIFGRGGVLSAFVTGVELVTPLGFSSVNKALESTLEGADWMLSKGIVPIYSPFSPTTNSEYDKASGPSVDYFIRLNVEAAKLRRKHKLFVNPRFVCSGCTYAQIECDLDRLM